jgi:hypothetical protein
MTARFRASQAVSQLACRQWWSPISRFPLNSVVFSSGLSSRWQQFSVSSARGLAKAKSKPKASSKSTPEPEIPPPPQPSAIPIKVTSTNALVQELSRSKTPILLYKAPSHRGLYASAYITSTFMLGSGIGIYWFGNWGLPEGFESKLEAVACSLVGGLFLFFAFYFGSSSFNLVKEIAAVPVTNGARRTLQLQVKTRPVPLPFFGAKTRTYAVQDLSIRSRIAPHAAAIRAFYGLKDRAEMTLWQKLQLRIIFTPIYQTRTVLFREGFVTLKDGNDNTVGKIDARGTFLNDGISE